jgi:putative chitinase
MTFSFNFTPDKLRACVPGNPRILDWYDVMTQTLPEYQITTWQRVAQWIAQVGHESGDFRTVTENLNYRNTALSAKFGNRITLAEANRLGRNDATGQRANQEGIANVIYGGEWGRRNLGNTQPGDGWRFRGRGLIQVTGRSNYSACSRALYGDEQILLTEPDLLSEPDGAIRSACWFWNSRKLNVPSDMEDIITVTRLINGGTNGLDDRRDRYARARRVLSA